MARSRLIKPKFFMNEELADLPLAARMLFIGLWCLADRDGRLLDRPRTIKAEIFPYDDFDVNNLLTELHNKNFIVRYEIDGEKLIQVTNFNKHQNPHPKEQSGGLPPVPEAKSRVNKIKIRVETTPKQEQAGPFPFTSFTSLPSFSNPSYSTPMAAMEVDERTQISLKFQVFWSHFPKQRAGSREAAFRAYLKAVKSDTPENILVGCIAYAASEEVEKRMAKGCAAWLNDDRWRNDYSRNYTMKGIKNGKTGYSDLIHSGIIANAEGEIASTANGNGQPDFGSLEYLGDG